MDNITIIDKIDPNDKSEQKERIFFTIGNMQENEITRKLIKILKSSQEISKGKTLYKYEGVEVSMSNKDIPKLVKKLVENDIDIYSIYKKNNS